MKHPIISLAIIATLAFESCNLYNPTVMNSPVLEEKGELNVGGSLGSTVDANLSYAVTNHFAVLGSAGVSGSINVEYSSLTTQQYKSEQFRNYKVEGAAGYFTQFKKKFLCNAFIGYAQGESGALVNDFYFNNRYPDDDGAYGANFSSVFFQTALQSKLTEKISLGVTGRLNSIHLSNISYSFDPTITGRYVAHEKDYLVGQFAFDFNVKWKKIGVFSQIQFALHDGYNDFFTVRRLGLHAGFYLRLDEIFK